MTLSAAIEAATGIAVIADPAFVVREIFGVGLSRGGVLGRLAFLFARPAFQRGS
jgi:hypothetical protein